MYSCVKCCNWKQRNYCIPVENGEEENEDLATRKELLNKLARLYQTYQLWVEEPLMHDSCLYLPSLPPQYQSDRLYCVFQQQMVSGKVISQLS